MMHSLIPQVSVNWWRVWVHDFWLPRLVPQQLRESCQQLVPVTSPGITIEIPVEIKLQDLYIKAIWDLRIESAEDNKTHWNASLWPLLAIRLASWSCSLAQFRASRISSGCFFQLRGQVHGGQSHLATKGGSRPVGALSSYPSDPLTLSIPHIVNYP